MAPMSLVIDLLHGVPPVVLHVAQSVETGVAHVVTDHVRHQLAQGWRIVVACPPGPLADMVLAAGAEVRTWRSRRDPGPSVVAEARSLGRAVAEVDPHIVHLHSAKAGLVGRLVLRGRRPTVYTPHAWSWLAAEGATRTLAVAWERYAARWADVTVCLSRGEIADARAAGLEGATVLIPNDLNIAGLRASAPSSRQCARTRLGLPDGPVVVCCARLAPQKGQDVLLEAWPAVVAQVPDAKLVLVGDGPDRELLERAAAPLTGVRLAGAVSRDEAGAWLKAASVVTCPSRYEGMSLVPLESAALGVPVVASDVQGMRVDLPATARRLVPPENPEALACALVQVLADPAEASYGGRLAAEWADGPGRGQSSPERTIALYAQLLGLPSVPVVAA
jgi:glycosyltransferase involved in cell wall biosynthesis